MGKKKISRRSFVRNTVLGTSALSIGSSIPQYAFGEKILPPWKQAPLKWLDTSTPDVFAGTTWGVPWKKGAVKNHALLQLQSGDGKNIPVQSWPLAYWPDGSLKWTGHALSQGMPLSEKYFLQEGAPAKASLEIRVTESKESFDIDTGVIQCTIAKAGTVLVREIKRSSGTIVKNGRLVMINRSTPEVNPEAGLVTEKFAGAIASVALEQRGPLRAVVKIEGKHQSGDRSWLPFVVRLYFYAGSEAIRVLHTIVFDGDESKDFLAGIGMRFDVPLEGETYNRHIRFAGDGHGVFFESVQTLTGLRRDPGAEVRKAQTQGKEVGPLHTLPGNFPKNMQYVPCFGDYTLKQHTPDSFGIQKRTKEGNSWIQSGFGKRSGGTGFIGTPKGGLLFGIRNFWQSFPAQLDIRNAHTDTGEVTLWLWAPDAAPMDLRFYHDGMGQDTYPKQLDALDITYEDYEPGFGTPMGVARTSEMQLWVLDGTPSNENFAATALSIQAPPQMVATPEYLKESQAFAGSWDWPTGNHPTAVAIERQLEFYIDYYQKQIDIHRWYGFWNYGDVMHTYDAHRHAWRYDVGGFAWDNSELSTDIWLWMYFLRSGKADVFRMAEAMTRHTGEVDVHHLGPFSPLGSRHNVQHWGCSAKQLRISTVANRRYYYYLTADERVGDLMKEQVEAYRTLQQIAPGRKLPAGDVQRAANDPEKMNMAFGTDWGAVASAWLTEWERTLDKEIYTKLTNSMSSIAAQPHGFFTGGGSMDWRTGKFDINSSGRISVSHLNAAFGLPETCAELIQAIDVPAFEKAWLRYCRLYNASAEEQRKEIGQPLGRVNLRQSHSRLTAYAANRLKDKYLAKRAWAEFMEERAGELKLKQLSGSVSLHAFDEAAFVSTNGAAQWSLAAMECLAYIGEYLGDG